MPFEPPWRPLRNAPVDTIKGRKTWFWHQRRGYNLGRCEPLLTAFTGHSVVNFHYTAMPKRTSLVSYFVQSQFVISTKNLRYVSSPMMSARAITPFGLLVKTVEKRTETIEGSGGKRHHAASMASLRRSMQRSFEDLWKPSMVVFPPPTAACCSFYCHDSPRLSRNNIIT